MDDPGCLTMSAKELNRLEVLRRVLERRLTQAQAAEQLGAQAHNLQDLVGKFLNVSFGLFPFDRSVTGSELPIAVEAYEQLTSAGVKARVVSLPCWELFDEQDEVYRNEVLPPNVTARVAVEAGVRMGWDRYLGSSGRFVGMTSFGASAPFKTLYEHFGITAEAVVAAAREVMAD